MGDPHQTLRLFDAHCHLQAASLQPHLDAVLDAAASAGVVACAVNATCEEDWPTTLALAARAAASQAPGPALHPSLGIHPWRLGGAASGWEDRLRTALLANPAAGVGESGLDRAPKGLAAAPPPAQAAALETHLALALSLHRPLSLHCVRATGPLTDLLEARGPFPSGVVMHAWAGSPDATARLGRVGGVYFSVGARQLLAPPPKGQEGCVQPLSPKAAPLLAAIPRGRLLVETDAPDGWVPGVGAPVVGGVVVVGEGAAPAVPGPAPPLNQPATLGRVLGLVSAASGRSAAEVAAETWAAAAGVFCFGKEGGELMSSQQQR